MNMKQNNFFHVVRDFYVILDQYKTGAWKEKIAGLYQSQFCRNLRSHAVVGRGRIRNVNIV
jgi:hypothetical protein